MVQNSDRRQYILRRVPMYFRFYIFDWTPNITTTENTHHKIRILLVHDFRLKPFISSMIIVYHVEFIHESIIRSLEPAWEISIYNDIDSLTNMIFLSNTYFISNWLPVWFIFSTRTVSILRPDITRTQHFYWSQARQHWGQQETEKKVVFFCTGISPEIVYDARLEANSKTVKWISSKIKLSHIVEKEHSKDKYSRKIIDHILKLKQESRSLLDISSPLKISRWPSIWSEIDSRLVIKMIEGEPRKKQTDRFHYIEFRKPWE